MKPHILFCIAVLTVMFIALARAADLSTVLGVAHVDGKYSLTHDDFLNEGADQVLAAGSKVIKVYLAPMAISVEQ